VKDLYEVLRAKQAQQAQLRQQIEALQAAAKDLEAVEYLLQDDGPALVSGSTAR
jgi:cell division protein FtsB